jgi:hypothetical protein
VGSSTTRPLDAKSLSDLRIASASVLRDMGVAAFAGPGYDWRHGRIIPLLWMLAFELGAATQLEKVHAQDLLSAAGMVMLVSFLARAPSARFLGVDEHQRRWWLLAILVLPMIGSLFLLLAKNNSRGPGWLPWTNAAVILATLYAAAYLLLPPGRKVSKRGIVGLWVLNIFVAATTALLSSPLFLEALTGEDEEHTSLPAFVVVCGVLVIWRVIRLLKRLTDVRLPGRRNDADRRVMLLLKRWTALGVLLFGLLQGLLMYFFDGPVFIVGVVVLCLSIPIIAGLHALSAGRRRGPVPDPADEAPEGLVQRQFDEPRLRYWILGFLLLYPALSLVTPLGPTMTDDVLGSELGRWGLAVALLLFNGLYLFVVWVLTNFGVGDLASWTVGEAWRSRVETFRQVVRAAPLLLIFVFFFALTAETWHLADNLSPGALAAVLSFMAVLAVLLLLIRACFLVREQSRFTTWDEVQHEIGEFDDPDKRTEDERKVARQLQDFLTRKPQANQLLVKSRLDVNSWCNALLVLFVYASFLFLPVVIVLFLVILAFVYLAVPAEVAAE